MKFCLDKTYCFGFWACTSLTVAHYWAVGHCWSADWSAAQKHWDGVEDQIKLSPSKRSQSHCQVQHGLCPSYKDPRSSWNSLCLSCVVPLRNKYPVALDTKSLYETICYSSFNKHEFLSIEQWNVAYWAYLIGWNAVLHSSKVIWIG